MAQSPWLYLGTRWWFLGGDVNKMVEMSRRVIDYTTCDLCAPFKMSDSISPISISVD